MPPNSSSQGTSPLSLNVNACGPKVTQCAYLIVPDQRNPMTTDSSESATDALTLRIKNP